MNRPGKMVRGLGRKDMTMTQGQDSWTERHGEVLAASALGAQALHGKEGFRLRDLRFLTELFLNWLNLPWDYFAKLQNTQLLRYMNRLVHEGHARKIEGARPHYLLTRAGFLHLLETLHEGSQEIVGERFLFRYMFLKVYEERILAVIKEMGKQFSRALEIEVRRLCDPILLLGREIQRVEEQLERIQARIAEAHVCADVVREALKKGVSEEKIIDIVEREYAYELNNQRALKDVLSLIPRNYRLWEVSKGAELRATILWRGQCEGLEQYLGYLKGLQEEKRSR